MTGPNSRSGLAVIGTMLENAAGGTRTARLPGNHAEDKRRLRRAPRLCDHRAAEPRPRVAGDAGGSTPSPDRSLEFRESVCDVSETALLILLRPLSSVAQGCGGGAGGRVVQSGSRSTSAADRVGVRGAPERGTAGQHLVQDAPEGPDVRRLSTGWPRACSGLMYGSGAEDMPVARAGRRDRWRVRQVGCT